MTSRTLQSLRSLQSLVPRALGGQDATEATVANEATGATVDRRTEPGGRARGAGRSDRIARGVILGGGALVLLLLAWGHLGLGALLFPPAATAHQQTAWAGPYAVQLVMTSGQLTARGPNTITVIVRDAHGQAVDHASVRIAAGMTSMPMVAPTLSGANQGSGRYLAHPLFGMAGPWQLEVTVSLPGQPARHVPFNVGVRWS